jgi:methylated-DNA-[protein]-cysteine S-methyltransferase
MKADSYAVFKTASGFCGIAWSEVGITRFQLPTDDAAATERLLLRRMSNAKAVEPTRDIAGVIETVRRYFEGGKVDFSDLNLDLDGQDNLFKQIYALARRLEWGQTTTYGALAKEIDADPRLARDVGQAMARNPIPLIIPCHRVLAAGGKVGGFSAPGGSASKIRMLQLEGIAMTPEPPAQASLGF